MKDNWVLALAASRMKAFTGAHRFKPASANSKLKVDILDDPIDSIADISHVGLPLSFQVENRREPINAAKQAQKQATTASILCQRD